MPETLVGVPVLSGLKLSPRSFSLAGRNAGRGCVKPTKHNRGQPACTRRVTLTIRYTLNTTINVSFGIAGSLPGRKAGRVCVRRTSKNRRHKKCNRHITFPGSTITADKAGPNRLVLVRKLAPGNYTLTATPTSGAPQRITFKILP